MSDRSKEIAERAVLIKIVKNPELHFYIPELLLGCFKNPIRKQCVYAMKELYLKQYKVTPHNIVLFIQREERVIKFCQKWKMNRATPTEIEVELELYDYTDPNSAMFEEAYEMLLETSFQEFVSEKTADMIHDNSYGRTSNVVAIANAIARLHKIIFKRKFEIKADDIKATADSVNKGDSYIPTFSRSLNKIITGWSRGYPAVLLARSQHNKTTFIKNEIRHKVHHGIKSLVLSTEEDPIAFWRGIYAAECKIPISGMKAGTYKISDQNVELIKSLYEDKVIFRQQIYYKNLMDILYSTDAQFIIIDHINAIKYEGTGSGMANMIGGIPTLIQDEKHFLSTHKEKSILNLMQVKEKDISNIKSHWKEPNYELAYGASLPHIASREFVSLYYPYKDVVSRPVEWIGKSDIHRATIHDLYAKVEKSSFSDMGTVRLYVEPDFSYITEYVERKGSAVEQGTIILPE